VRNVIHILTIYSAAGGFPHTRLRL